nr:LysM peptidoglycan-binding domain-containing protein [Bacillus siamensis]
MVKKGDVLSVITEKTGVSMKTLQSLNGIKDPNLIKSWTSIKADWLVQLSIQ